MLKLSAVWFTLLCVTIAQDSKLQSLRTATATVDVLDTDWDNFKQYVVDGPRNYTAITFFTSESADLKCPSCPMIKEQFLKLAKWYNDAVPQQERILFFVIAEWGKNLQVFRTYHEKIKTMPTVIIIKSTIKKGTQLKFDEKDKIPIYSDISSEYMSQYINSHLGLELINAPEPSHLAQYAMISVIVILIIWNFYRHHKNEVFWLCGSLLVPWFTYTGTYFNLNTNPPFVYMHPSNHQMVIIWPSQQMQTVLEGFLVATLIITLGICFAIFTIWVPSLSYSRRRLSFWLMLILLLGLLGLYAKLWSIKTPWYLVYQ